MTPNVPQRALVPGTTPSTRPDAGAPHLRVLDDAFPLDNTIAAARDALVAQQSAEGYWLFELEADCTIPAEYILMMHFLGEIDDTLQSRIASYLRAHQGEHDGWPLYHNGDFDMSCSVKAYMALKLAGDSPDAPHMARARAAILERGGAARSNVFTRITLALFAQVPWRAVPYIPVEIMLFPRWFPFHLSKVSYWSRAVMVPLFILCTRKPVARNPRKVGIRELFTTPPDKERNYLNGAGHQGSFLARVFRVLDRVGRAADPVIPKTLRARAMQRAESWMLERLNGEDGLGAIFPAMVNALEAMVVLGYPTDDPRRVTAKHALEKLVVSNVTNAYCQPCVSPVWDSALACLAMQATGGATAHTAWGRGLDWLRTKQLLDKPGDWRERRPHLRGGGWAFQFGNGHYPDLDDTGAVVWALHQADDPARYGFTITRALDWLVGMQSSNGGFAAYDVDNTYYYLNEIPFADHGALLDPPTSDVTARVVAAMARADRAQDKSALERAIRYLRREQEDDGSWFGRWGTNYIYGTWSVLCALALAGVSGHDPAVRRAVSWLAGQQNSDGGWGESNDGYRLEGDRRQPASTPHQTAWALLALIASGETGSVHVRRGIDYLMRTQQADGLWSDPHFTAPGFPRVFYLRYHGYCAYFPLWALAAYRNATRPGTTH
ncbi:MAG TPA: squalene--hopene cyclase [Steroidobacteraceae bacterium]|nr:squalene--hopene cyclase [Steroidobacteraceae bacterium]